jgi:hypothetical protein
MCNEGHPMTNPHTTHRMTVIRSEIIAMMKAFAGVKKALGMKERTEGKDG